MSYNVLAKCFTDCDAGPSTFPKTPLEYLPHSYRRILLAHEIKS